LWDAAKVTAAGADRKERYQQMDTRAAAARAALRYLPRGDVSTDWDDAAAAAFRYLPRGDAPCDWEDVGVTRATACYATDAERCYGKWRDGLYLDWRHEHFAEARAGNAVYEKGEPIRVPKNYKQAMESPQAAEWTAAMQEHLDMHDQLGTWQEVFKPLHQRAIPCRWVFATKTDADGEVTRYKARTVVWGNLQKEGIDFGETFSPTVRGEQVRLLIAIGAQIYGHKLRECAHIQDVTVIAVSSILGVGDVKNAYLNSPLEEDNVLTELPQGCKPKRSAPAGSKVLARQIKAHPGLRQAGRAWYKTVRAELLARGYVQSAVAPCIFNKDMACGGYLSLGIFVDDLVGLNASADADAFKGLAASLKDCFEVVVTVLDKFLGAQFDIESQGIRMHLTLYITGMLTRFEMQDCKPARSPEAQREDAEAPADETLLGRSGIKLYQEQTGALMYCATTCRLDLAHAVGMLARRMSAPRVCDTAAVKRVFRYLQGAKNLGILYRFATDSEFPGLVAHCDSDWAGDGESRKSTSGFVVKYNGAPVSWSSSLQSVVACSSCEAEYVAASECGREVSYLRELTSFVNNAQPGPTQIFGDNQGALSLIENPAAHKRTKHIEVRYHWIRVAQERGVIKVMKVHTDDNYSDIMTKATGTGTFCRHVGSLMAGPAAATADAVAAAVPAATKPAAEPAAEPVAKKAAAASKKPRRHQPTAKRPLG
jgi:hypothetical protein